VCFFAGESGDASLGMVLVFLRDVCGADSEGNGLHMRRDKMPDKFGSDFSVSVSASILV
jgi:hypothetical protein